MISSLSYSCVALAQVGQLPAEPACSVKTISTAMGEPTPKKARTMYSHTREVWRAYRLQRNACELSDHVRAYLAQRQHNLLDF